MDDRSCIPSPTVRKKKPLYMLSSNTMICSLIKNKKLLIINNSALIMVL